MKSIANAKNIQQDFREKLHKVLFATIATFQETGGVADVVDLGVDQILQLIDEEIIGEDILIIPPQEYEFPRVWTNDQIKGINELKSMQRELLGK